MVKVSFIVLILCVPFRYAYSDDASPVEIKAVILDNNAPDSNGKSPLNVTIDLQVVNISNKTQDIGETNSTGELSDLIIDNPSIHSSFEPVYTSVKPWEVILKPGEVWKEKDSFIYMGEKGKSGPLTFRLGINKAGQQLGWSDLITVNLVSGQDG
jgi:hypothetical protein